MGEKDMHTEFLENLKDREHLQDLSTDGRIILKWILKKWDESVFRIGTNHRLCEHGNEPSGSKNFREFLD
jgi:hypothetical protein